MIFFSSAPGGKGKRTQRRPPKKHPPKKSAPVTELSLPERIEEVLLPSTVHVPGFEGFVTAEEEDNNNNKKKVTKTKKKPDDDDNADDEGAGKGKAAKRRKLEEGRGRAPSGSAPARSIAWNRYGTLLAGKKRSKEN